MEWPLSSNELGGQEIDRPWEHLDAYGLFGHQLYHTWNRSKLIGHIVLMLMQAPTVCVRAGTAEPPHSACMLFSVLTAGQGEQLRRIVQKMRDELMYRGSDGMDRRQKQHRKWLFCRRSCNQLRGLLLALPPPVALRLLDEEDDSGQTARQLGQGFLFFSPTSPAHAHYLIRSRLRQRYADARDGTLFPLHMWLAPTKNGLPAQYLHRLLTKDHKRLLLDLKRQATEQARMADFGRWFVHLLFVFFSHGDVSKRFTDEAFVEEVMGLVREVDVPGECFAVHCGRAANIFCAPLPPALIHYIAKVGPAGLANVSTPYGAVSFSPILYQVAKGQTCKQLSLVVSALLEVGSQVETDDADMSDLVAAYRRWATPSVGEERTVCDVLASAGLPQEERLLDVFPCLTRNTIEMLAERHPDADLSASLLAGVSLYKEAGTSLALDCMLEMGADIEVEDEAERTVLHVAHRSIIPALLERGADPDGGATLPLMRFLHLRKWDPSLAGLVTPASVRRIVTPSSGVQRGRSLLAEVAGGEGRDVCLLEALLEAGADVSGAPGDEAPMTRAIMSSNRTYVEFLLDHGASLPTDGVLTSHPLVTMVRGERMGRKAKKAG